MILFPVSRAWINGFYCELVTLGVASIWFLIITLKYQIK